MSPNAERLVGLAKLFNIRDFFETGTCNGALFREVEGYFDRAFTIELHGPPSRIVAEFSGSGKHFLFTGSSGDELGRILQEYKITRALFWLDAHGNQTFFNDDGNNQVYKELDAITKYAPDSLVVLDDVTWEKGKDGRVLRWVNTSYEFIPPSGWSVKYVARVAILHRGAYSALEHI